MLLQIGIKNNALFARQKTYLKKKKMLIKCRILKQFPVKQKKTYAFIYAGKGVLLDSL
jgi:hypothetical protein